MNALESFKRSTAWDNRHGLPLVPMHNNPFIYSAYAKKICVQFDTLTDIRMMNHIDACEVEPGLFNRWPDGTGGVTSHDEIMGLAYHSQDTAEDILYYLEKNDGVYFNVGTDAAMNFNRLEIYNVYRFVFLKPFLKSAAGYRVGMISQLQFSSFLIYDLITHSKKELDPGGRLRIWIMLEAMEKYPLSGMAIFIWRKVMKNKGIGPKKCFNHYLAEVPIFKETAPEGF